MLFLSVGKKESQFLYPAMRFRNPFVLLLLLMQVFCTVQSQNWTHHTILDGDGIFHLYWTPPEDERGDSKIDFKVEMKAKGYFGLGFSTNGGMPGSDIVTGWIKGSEVYFQDRHAFANSLPPKDDQQDYELIDAYENDTFSVFQFRRKLDTCDQNDMVIDGSTMRVIYAYSTDDPESDEPFYHRENRGVRSIMLLQTRGKEELDLNSTAYLYWDVISPDVDISNISTLYWCKIFKSPEVSEKHHVISVKTLIQEGHEQFVHHMLMYECVGGTPEEYEKFLDYRGHECYHPSRPVEMFNCQGLTSAWAIGGDDLVLPKHVGLPWEPNIPKYYRFEIHYDNTHGKKGTIDHSGLRIIYTPNIREFDAGNFRTGASILPRVFIPPGQEEYVVVGHSSKECLGAAIPDTGVKFLGVSLHAHMIAKDIKARHFRGNKELVPLAHDKNYDFEMQNYIFFSKEVDILPDDQISVECTYDSSQRSNVTIVGLSTTEEMCFGTFLYYPFVNRYISFSGPSYATINDVLNTNVTNREEVNKVLSNYDWTSVNIEEVQNAMRYSKHETQCYLGPIQSNGEMTMISYPNDLIRYEPEPKCIVAA